MMDFNYSNILVGIDGSKTAAKAVKQAIIIADHNHAKLTIVAVINDREILGVLKPLSLVLATLISQQSMRFGPDFND